MTDDTVIDFACERGYRLSLIRRACAYCLDDRHEGGDERLTVGHGWRWLCDACAAEVDASGG